MFKLPITLPAVYKLLPGQAPAVSDLDTGGYDILIGGHGYRLATDQQFQYQRYSEPTTVHRFDSSLEPGEQTLSEVPWIKAQASFHGGAGQLNLEQGFVAFQYQQEQVEHIRFDTCLGIDPWTPGVVKRLPDCTFTTFTQSTTQMVTATVSGVDYAIVGGTNAFYQIAWNSGPNGAPTITSIDMTANALGGISNVTIASLATDGGNYYGLVQLTAPAPLGNSNTMTYVISGSVASAAAPTIIYSVPVSVSGPTRHNLCPNPSFETDTAGWSDGVSGASLASSSAQAKFGTKSMFVTWGTSGAQTQVALINFSTVIGRQYTVSAYVYVPAAMPRVAVGATRPGFGASAISAPTNTTGQWQRMSTTYVATTSTSQLVIQAYDAPTTGQNCYVDGVLIEDSQVLGVYFDGSTTNTSSYTYAWDGTAQESTSTATPIGIAAQAQGIIGWAKERLMGAFGGAVYELPVTTGGFASLPSPKYTHPVSTCMFTAISSAPDGILVATQVGEQASILNFTLDTSGSTPILAGAATVAQLPPGEIVLSLQNYLGSFLGIGTTFGVRVGTFDTYTGALKYGPLSVSTTAPVYAIAGRDRFIYFSYTNQQADGTTGLGRIDLSMVVDQGGRNAWAPDLRPPTSAPTGHGTVAVAGVLPLSNRIVFITPEGICVEGSGPGSNGDAWIRTSRIRYDTAEPKLFTVGRVHGTLDVANIQVTGIYPFGISNNLGTFGFVTGGSDASVQFGLGNTLNEWMQLKFDLVGAACQLNSYQVKAIPQPTRQNIIVVTANCFRNEVDRFGLDVTDPELPRQRYQNLRDLESTGGSVRFVEFTNTGSVAEIVTIDQIQFQSFSRPNIDDDFGGYITIKMRTVS